MMKTHSTILCALAGLLALALQAPPTAWAQNPFLKQQSERVITEIRFEGNEHTKDYVLSRELGFGVGDVYNDDALNDAWYRLEQLEFIAYVDITLDRPAPGEITLLIQVEEDKRFLWEPLLFYTRRFDWFYGASGKMIDFRGRGEVISAKAYWGHITHYSLGWSNPWILGDAKLGVGVSGYFEDYWFVYEPFNFQDVGGRFDLQRKFGKYLEARANYTYRSTVIYDNAITTVYPAPGTTVDPYVHLGLVWDSRNLRYYPSRGIHAKLTGTQGGVGGDLDTYSFYDVYFAAFQSVPKLGIVCGRVAYHGTEDPMPVYERSYLGGPSTVRGIDFSSLRGDRNFLATVELRRPIFLVPLREGRAVGFGVHGFFDWGQAWDYDVSASDIKLRYAGGVGLHFNLNTYNFRFEWAWSDHDGNSFVFADRFNF